MQYGMKCPILSFESAENREPLCSQTKNLSHKWDERGEQIFNSINYYVNCRWQIDNILVKTEQLIVKGSEYTPYQCYGEVNPDEPQIIHLSIGKKVQGGGTKLMAYLVHEVIHSLVSSNPDYRFNKPGKLEDRIFDELATDLLAEHVMHSIFHRRINTINSVKYALTTVAQEIVDDKEYKSEREEIIKRANKAVREYLKTDKNYFSLRKKLMQI